PAPGQRDGGQHGQQRHDDEEPDQEPVEGAARLGLDVGAWRPGPRRLGRARGGRGGRDGGGGGGRGGGLALHRRHGRGGYAYVTVTYETVSYTRGLTQTSPRSGVENIGRTLSVSLSEKMCCRGSAAGRVVDPGPGARRVVVPGQPQQRLEAVERRFEPGLPREDALPVRPENLQVGRPEIAVDGDGRGEQA